MDLKKGKLNQNKLTRGENIETQPKNPNKIFSQLVGIIKRSSRSTY